ncbi:MAG: hypothetical protein PHI35_07685, partial [Victivallaceae bacterium]|nr:hypothetical protein [Victivallaceae bacterium]
LTAAGYAWEDDPAPELVTPVKRYSKYKIAAALGSAGYAALLARIDAANLRYLWDVANELASDDPNFQTFFAGLSAAEKVLLEECEI